MYLPPEPAKLVLAERLDMGGNEAPWLIPNITKSTYQLTNEHLISRFLNYTSDV